MAPLDGCFSQETRHHPPARCFARETRYQLTALARKRRIRQRFLHSIRRYPRNLIEDRPERIRLHPTTGLPSLIDAPSNEYARIVPYKEQTKPDQATARAYCHHAAHHLAHRPGAVPGP